MDDESQKYLLVFHYLLPPLFMNFIEKTLISKDKVAKKQIDNVNLFVYTKKKVSYFHFFIRMMDFLSDAHF